MNSFFFQPVIFCTPLFIPHMHIGQLLLTLPPITSTSSPFFDFQTIVARVIPKLWEFVTEASIAQGDGEYNVFWREKKNSSLYF